MNRQAPKMAHDLMELLRSQTLTRDQILKQLDWCDKAAANWTRDLTDLGVLVEIELPRQPGRGGYGPKGYRLSPKFGGVVA